MILCRHSEMPRQPFGSAQSFGFGLIFSSEKHYENHVAKSCTEKGAAQNKVDGCASTPSGKLLSTN